MHPTQRGYALVANEVRQLIEETFGAAFAGEDEARKVLVDVNTLADYLAAEGKF